MSSDRKLGGIGVQRIVQNIGSIVLPWAVFGVAWQVSTFPIPALAWVVGFAAYVLTGFGVSMGFHRLFTHRSFEAAPWLRVALACAGSLSLQGSLFQWVADHRQHHQFSDHDGDPHSPWARARTEGRATRERWWAHIGWMLSGHHVTDVSTLVPDLRRDPVLIAIDRAYPAWMALTFGLPFAVGLLFGDGNTALWCMAIGGGLRVIALHQVTWAVNSLGHTLGSQHFNTGDESRNLMPLALVTFGEGWHNTHHAFPGSYRFALLAGHVDVTAATIRVLARTGAASFLREPSQRQILSRRSAEGETRTARRPRTSPPVTRLAVSTQDREAIFQLRYAVYVEEMRRPQKDADHHGRRIEDGLDDRGTILGAWVGHELAGTIRTNCLRDGPVGYYEGLYGLDELSNDERQYVSITTRMMVLPRFRRSRVAATLASDIYAFALTQGVRFDFMDCNPHLVTFFEHLGYRPHRSVRHDEYGEVVVMRLDAFDARHLQRVGSPFYARLQQCQAELLKR